MQNTDILKQFIKQSSRIMAFTGAGISAESGIPTYRGAGGVWTEYDPEKYASIEYFCRDPGYFWRFFKDIRLGTVTQAQPNGAHLALAELERKGKITAVVTQNIDGLHQRAGSNNIIELHGNTTRFYCSACGKKFDLETVKQLLLKEEIPHCDCYGVLRPDVVLFGEFLPENALMEANNKARDCDLCLSIGSSLVVYPAAEIPYIAKQSGAKLVIINIDKTPLDTIADLVINYSAEKILMDVVNVS